MRNKEVPVSYQNIDFAVNHYNIFTPRSIYRSRTKLNMNVVVFCLLTFSCLFRNAFSHKCDSSGFSGCECNILGACNKGNPVPGLDDKFTGYAPKDIQQFKYGWDNLAYLCETQATTIMYDCNARIPLYSATMMTGNQLKARYKRKNYSFRHSGDAKLHPDFQQRNSDYLNSNQRELCYESQNREYLTDKEWYLSKTGAASRSWTRL